jgi:hypothetical protein
MVEMTKLEEFKNINKVPSYKAKIELVYGLIEKGDISKAYDMVNAIIESVGIIYMKKQYDIDVAYSNLGYLGNILIEKKDEDIANEFLTVNAYLNMLVEDDDHEISENNIDSLLFDFDRILFWILIKDDKFFE